MTRRSRQSIRSAIEDLEDAARSPVADMSTPALYIACLTHGMEGQEPAVDGDAACAEYRRRVGEKP